MDLEVTSSSCSTCRLLPSLKPMQTSTSPGLTCELVTGDPIVKPVPTTPGGREGLMWVWGLAVSNIGALIIRIGFGVMLYHNYTKKAPQNPIQIIEAPYMRHYGTKSQCTPADQPRVSDKALTACPAWHGGAQKAQSLDQAVRTRHTGRPRIGCVC